jgi:predicted CopG family antitoxin
LENSDVLKRLYEIKKDTGLQMVSRQVDHIKVKLLRQH